MATKTIVMPRDAKTGRLVSPAEAARRPASTVVEHRKVQIQKPTPSKKGK